MHKWVSLFCSHNQTDETDMSAAKEQNTEDSDEVEGQQFLCNAL